MRPSYTRSFLETKKPLLAAMIENTTERGCLSDMRIAEHDGADAFAIDFAMIDPACREEEVMKRIIRSTGLPVLLYTYRNYHLENATDEERAELQLRAARMGAACCDVMGDLFCPSERQLTNDPTAVRKQKRLIEEIHQAGAVALMSSHLSEPVGSQYVLDHMSRMVERGADVAKLVAQANTPREFAAAMETACLLQERLPVPFIFLCSGKYGPLQRYNTVLLGGLLTFSVPRYTERVLGVQPLTCDARRTMDELLRRTAYPED